MARLCTKLRSVEGGLVAFWCPGCDARHHVSVDPANAMAWAYNGNPDAPTFNPSVLVRSGHHIPGWQGPTCWCNWEQPAERTTDHAFKCTICHSFVTDGQITFLADSTHKLAGQTVPLPDYGTLS